MRKVVLIFTILLLLTACSEVGDSTEEYEVDQHEGIIAKKKQLDGERDVQQILVISEVEKDEIKGKTISEINELAGQHDSAYYAVDEDQFAELQIGMRVEVYWTGEQLDSNPPQRGADEVNVVE
ncbi:DUF3221 domain-containing protein [Alkalibacillus haloalkaliphilus]|uniref:DUF3221 domain-containing protein n=1 Tax=Alkalibacillus haloalkaliphilus TaxID=94136 RepID=A0A511W5W6_9BACI|nr:DUF3221 domain-containing protein [Alkalibacillus haloalkaliphilus]GEN45443.1 hypothetical protein AHA02nite_12190 [Alkalibacillus haloalkaliphilus]